VQALLRAKAAQTVTKLTMTAKRLKCDLWMLDLTVLALVLVMMILLLVLLLMLLLILMLFRSLPSPLPMRPVEGLPRCSGLYSPRSISRRRY